MDDSSSLVAVIRCTFLKVKVHNSTNFLVKIPSTKALVIHGHFLPGFSLICYFSELWQLETLRFMITRACLGKTSQKTFAIAISNKAIWWLPYWYGTRRKEFSSGFSMAQRSHKIFILQSTIVLKNYLLHPPHLRLFLLHSFHLNLRCRNDADPTPSPGSVMLDVNYNKIHYQHVRLHNY